MSEAIKNRYEFVVLFDVENGNPNGDPDAGNMPRVDPETGCGIVTDVCLKRKIRNYVEMVKEDSDRYRIYIKAGIPLNETDANAADAVGVGDEIRKFQTAEKKKAKEISSQIKKKEPLADLKIKDYLCEHYYDIRTFGAVITTLKKPLNFGQVRGPVQLAFAKSVDPIVPREISIARITQTKADDMDEKGSNTFGDKFIVPYGLYRVEGYISANLARKVTGFSEEDLELLWQAILNMFEYDHAAARGKMAVRKLVIFKHDSELGNAPAHKLFDAVHVRRLDEGSPARAYSDYVVTVDESAIPAGVTVECRE